VPPRLALVHAPAALSQAFRGLGWEVVLDLHPPGGELDLSQDLDKAAPDLFLQVEVLGPRLLLRGLEALPCPSLFWALDPHLNGFWQAAYGRLFDLTLSTQAKWRDDLAALGAATAHLPWFGLPLPWKPWESRPHEICFVGRVTAQRPARGWLLDFLRRHYGDRRLKLASDVGFAEMLALYGDSRLAPNESIMGEVNFRLFEAAASGCLVLGRDLGPEQAALFEPGREMEVFAHVAGLKARLDFLLKNPRAAQARARAAWERVQARHLPAHRARAILDLAQGLPRKRATGAEAALCRGLALFRLWEAGRLPCPATETAALLDSLPPGPLARAARLRFLVQQPGLESQARAAVAALWRERPADQDLDTDLAAGLGALRLDEWELARGFWLARLRALARPSKALLEPPDSPRNLLRLWARLLREEGRLLRPGFPFDPASHLPACAAECLFLALHLAPGDTELLRETDALLSACPGQEQMRVGFLSDLTLRRRQDWRPALSLGLASLACFRLEAGLEELAAARGLARSQGREAAFFRALASRDPDGLLAAALG
jgi:hypothetical protein